MAMAQNHAELAAVWDPIRTTLQRRHARFIALCLEYKIIEHIMDVVGQPRVLYKAVYKLPAHVFDGVREEFPLTADQLRAIESRAVNKAPSFGYYDTF
jgi:hypothetical protein